MQKFDVVDTEECVRNGFDHEVDAANVSDAGLFVRREPGRNHWPECFNHHGPYLISFGGQRNNAQGADPKRWGAASGNLCPPKSGALSVDERSWWESRTDQSFSVG